MARTFDDLKRVPEEPAMRLLSKAGLNLETPLAAPANAGVGPVLSELDAKEAVRDMLVLLAAALPARQRVWWACLSGRDLLGDEPAARSETLTAAENWVRMPDDEMYEHAYDAMQAADPMDPTRGCAQAVVFSGGKLGPGDLAEQDAPPGLAEVTALTMVIDAIGANPDNPNAYASLVIDRALDLAKGGSGKVGQEP